ncbi:MAG: LPP20 family lipoprotein [Spirochaetales bacterium]|nr:LPP20 family lipoprotein [Spirochaetales bacterium]
MKRSIVSGIFILLILITGCVSSPSSGFSSSPTKSSKQPAWVSDINSVYPDEEYLAVLGDGDTLSKAQAKASSNLALIFESRIVVDNTVESRYVEMQSSGVFSGSSSETAVTNNITQLSDQTLMNVKYGESWTDSMGKVIVAAYLNRKETAKLYSTRMRDQTDVLNRLISEGDRSGSRLSRFAYYDSAYIIAMANEVMKEQLEIISPATARTASAGYDIAAIKTARTGAAEDMSFRMEFTGDDEGNAASILAESLTDMGFSVSPSGEIAVTGSVRSEKIERNNDYQNFKWYLAIEIADETGKVIMTVNENGISTSTTESAARSRVNTDVKKVINKEFERQFNAYLNGFVDK